MGTDDRSEPRGEHPAGEGGEGDQPRLERLVEEARGGDRQAIDALMSQHLDGLTSFVRLRLGDGLRRRETSLDLVQSVCREVLGDLDRFEYRGASSFRNWLYKRAETKIHGKARFWGREKRDMQREQRLSDLTPRGASAAELDQDERLLAQLASFSSPSHQATAREELERVETAFASLAEDQREVILLARVVGLPHAEVAREMGRTPAATRTLLSRALARLATLLAEKDQG